MQTISQITNFLCIYVAKYLYFYDCSTLGALRRFILEELSTFNYFKH